MSRLRPRPQNVSNACVSCRRRKSKCSGTPGPCIDCQRRNIECTFEVDLDRRRNIKRRRLEQNHATNQLIDTIRNGEWDRLRLIRELLNQGRSVAEAFDETDAAHPDLRQDETDDSSGRDQPLSPTTTSTTSLSSSPVLPSTRYTALPLSTPNSSALGNAYTVYRDTARALMLHGAPARDILRAGARRTRVDLLFRARRGNDSHSVDNWASECNATFRSSFGTVTCLASAVLAARLLRWIIMPTEQLYGQVPEIIRPTTKQCSIEHDAAIDLTILPAIRDALCVRRYNEDVVNLMMGRLSFRWEGTLREATEEDGDAIYTSALFEREVADPRNWFVGQSILDLLPEIRGKVEVMDDNNLQAGPM